MSDAFVGEIKPFPFSFAPRNWAFCSGQQLPISQYQALYALIGGFYGTPTQTNFFLPDLRGRTPIHFGTSSEGIGYQVGAVGGAESVTLQATTLPAHGHAMNAVSSPGTQPQAGGGRPATVGVAVAGATPVPIYAVSGSGPTVALASDTVGSAGTGGAHNNVQPSLVLNYCIALLGFFPTRS